MSKYRFSAIERATVYNIHGEKCYICEQVIDLKTMQVDHIIPESLLEKPEKLQQALISLGLSSNFNINSFENWMPSCPKCNRTKSDSVFEPSLLIQIKLQQAREKSTKAEELVAKTVTNKKLANALNTLEQAHENGLIDKEIIEIIAKFVNKNRNTEFTNKPIYLTPLYTILKEENGIKIIKGPYGIGMRPSNKNIHSSFDCPTCGSISAWNGARCIICGNLNDD